MGAYISQLLFQPPDVSYLHAKKHIIWLKTVKNESIPAFFIDRKAQVTVLFSHGNAEDLGMIYEWFLEFSKDLNVNLFAYDYEGYGKASGEPSESAVYDDIDAAYTFLIDTLKMLPANIILYGRSLGSGPSTYLAEKLAKKNVRLGGLILQSPLLSVYRVAFNFRFTFPCDMFPNVDRIPHIACPLLVIHGTRDEVVPFWNGQDLFFASPVQWRSQPLWVENGGHNNLEVVLKENDVLYNHIRSFFHEWVPSYSVKGV